MRPRIIIHTIIQNHKGTGINVRFDALALILLNALHHQFLALHKVRQNNGVILSVNEHWWNNLFKETV